MLAGRLGCSVRQAHRHVDQAAAGGRVRLPEPGTVFTVKLPAGLARRVRAQARDAGITISSRELFLSVNTVETRSRRSAPAPGKQSPRNGARRSG